MFSSLGTAVSLNSDVRGGVFDRFRSLPIARSAPLAARSPEGVQGFSVVIIFPLTFGSNVFVPTAKLPGWLQAWVKSNPVSGLADAARGLLLDHPVGLTPLRSVAWSLGIVTVFAPAAVWIYRRRA